MAISFSGGMPRFQSMHNKKLNPPIRQFTDNSRKGSPMIIR